MPKILNNDLLIPLSSTTMLEADKVTVKTPEEGYSKQLQTAAASVITLNSQIPNCLPVNILHHK